MNAILKFLFPVKVYSTSDSWFLLVVRILFGLFLISHGVAKWQHFDTLSSTFPDPMHLGHSLSLVLAIFAEVICAAGFIAGAFYRLALIPMIFTMCIASLVVHHGDPFATKELAVVYLVVFVLMFIAGPGKYALDRLIAVRLTSFGSKK